MNFNATFFGQLLAFGVFVWFCMKFVWPLLLGMIQEREKRIADGLAAAEEGTRKLAEAEQRYQQSVDQGKQRAAEIIGQAERRGEEIVEEAKRAAQEEGKRQLAMAEGEIQRDRERTRQELRQQAAALAVAGAEQILQREVNADTHGAMLDQLSAKL